MGSNIDMENNSVTPLTTPHFDAEMISEAQPVEPLAPRGRRSWATGSLQNFVRRRLGVVIAIGIMLLLGAAAFGMFLGLRDRRTTTVETADQAASEPANAVDSASPVSASPVKAAPAKAPLMKSLARTEPTEIQAPKEKHVASPARLRRVLASPAEIDQALSGNSGLAAPRKVGELFGGGRPGERRGHRGEGRRRDRNDHE